MSITYSIAVRNARLAAVVAAIDAAPGPGRLQVLSSASVLLSNIQLNVPCGTIAGGVLTFTTPRVDFAAAATGNASVGQFVDSTGTVVASGLTVGVAGTDLIISPGIHIIAGDVVTFVSGQIIGN